MERALEQYSIHEPIDAAHAGEAVAGALRDGAAPQQRSFRYAAVERICANPLHDEPHPVIVGTVKRFGLVGLVACALSAGMVRWCKSLGNRVH